MPTPPDLTTPLALALCGWEWRDDWHAWCPPGWPSRTASGCWAGARYPEQLLAVQRHGGVRFGSAGRLDDRGRPVMPAYPSDPQATAILWQWLHAQPGIERVRFVPLPIPPESLRGVRPWRCAIVVEGDRGVTGEGGSHREALCRAVRALAHAGSHALG